MSVSHKLQYTVSSSTGSQSVSGYDTETGNSEIVIPTQQFAASTSNQSITLSLTAANLQSVFLVSDKGLTLKTNGTGAADVQTLSVSGTPTGGYIGVAFGGQTTVVPYDATASQVQSALQALSTIGSGNATCAGGPLPGTAITITFAGTLSTGQQPVIQTYSGELTGGTSPTASVVHTTPGLPTNTIVLAPGIPLVWGVSGYGSNPFTANVTSAYVSCTAAASLTGKICTA